MKIILQKEVERLGVPGDVVEVADGYARNFLIPRGLAQPATKGGMGHADRLRRAHDQRVRKTIQEAQEVADRLTASPLQLPARAGEDGRLFGSITLPKLADELQARAGVPIDRKRVHLSEPIRSLGSHEVTVHLHPEVDAVVIVEVVPQ